MKNIILKVSLLLLAVFMVSCNNNTNVITTVDPNSPIFSGIQDRAILYMDNFDVLDGISAYDNQDGDLTDNIEISVNNVDNTTIGDYIVEIFVTDSDQNRTDASFHIEVSGENFNNTDWINYDLSKIDLSFPLVLPRLSANKTIFIWSSNNPYVITDHGNVINPPIGSNAEEVILTCTGLRGGVSVNKSFTLTVNPSEEVRVTSETKVDFINTSYEYSVSDKENVSIYYVDNNLVPYIDIETFFEMVDGAIDTSIIDFTPIGENALSIDYSVPVTETESEYYFGYFDFDDNTFTISNYEFFSSYESNTTTDFGESLVYLGAYVEPGNEIIIPLGDYDFDLIIKEEETETLYLVPFQLANLLFLGNIYYDTYFNGEEIYGVDTFSVNEDYILNLISNSYLNQRIMEEEIRIDTYYFLAFLLDYFYGLRSNGDIDGFDIMVNYIDDLLLSDDTYFYNTLFDIIYDLDDMHTSYSFPGFYENPYYIYPSLNDLGSRSRDYYDAFNAMTIRLEQKYGSISSIPSVEFIDNDKTAIIHVFEFTVDTPGDFKISLDSLPESVENVVIDLSYNTGGNLGAVLRIFGYITEDTFSYHMLNPIDGSKYSYYFESDYVAYDYNWLVLTSPVTFSAANLFASIAREEGILLIGQNTSGGASSIAFVTTPDGSGMFVSSTYVLASRIENSQDEYVYSSIENGLIVDYYIGDLLDYSTISTIITQNIK